jgi:hypothetical protein
MVRATHPAWLTTPGLFPTAAVGNVLVPPQAHVDEHPIRPRDCARPVIERDILGDSSIASGYEGSDTEGITPRGDLGAVTVWFDIPNVAVVGGRVVQGAADRALVRRAPPPGDAGYQHPARVPVPGLDRDVAPARRPIGVRSG